MKNLSAEVESAIDDTQRVAKTDLDRWIRDGDLATRARVYALTASEWSRIEPTPGMEEQCRFMADYLLECLAANPDADDEYVHGGFEAGHAIARWLKYLVGFQKRGK